MKILSGEEIVGYLSKLIYRDTQVQKSWVDLTAKEIYFMESWGSLDFGGSELKIGSKKKHPTVKRKEEDKYGWWDLMAGQYLLEFNEVLSLPDGTIGVLQPRPELLANGVSHPTLLVTSGEDLPLIPLLVGNVGARIKENARVSRLYVFRVVD
jgi:deoxycytidine triphosphate deaminase